MAGTKLTIELNVKNLADKALKDINIQMNGVAVEAKKAFYEINREASKTSPVLRSVSSGLLSLGKAYLGVYGLRTVFSMARQHSEELDGAIKNLGKSFANLLEQMGAAKIPKAFADVINTFTGNRTFEQSLKSVELRMEAHEKKKGFWTGIPRFKTQWEDEKRALEQEKEWLIASDRLRKGEITDEERIVELTKEKLALDKQIQDVRLEAGIDKPDVSKVSGRLQQDVLDKRKELAELRAKIKDEATKNDPEKPQEIRMNEFRAAVKYGEQILELRNDARKREEGAVRDHNKYLNELAEASIRDAREKEAAQEEIRDRNLASAQLMFGGLASLAAMAAQQNKEFGTAYKTFAIAEATVNTYRAALQVMADPLIIGWLKIPAMIGTIAAGLAQVVNISNAKFASGTPFAPGGMSLVGEQGPEAVYLPHGARVYNSHETRNISNGNNITVNMPANTSVETNRDMVRRLEKMQRNGYLNSFMVKTVQYAGH